MPDGSIKINIPVGVSSYFRTSIFLGKSWTFPSRISPSSKRASLDVARYGMDDGIE